MGFAIGLVAGLLFGFSLLVTLSRMWNKELQLRQASTSMQFLELAQECINNGREVSLTISPAGDESTR